MADEINVLPFNTAALRCDDIVRIMDSLAIERAVFHNEADFQHALAWHIHNVWPSHRIRLECRFLDRRNNAIFVDLWIPDVHTVLELKYVTKKLVYRDSDEEFVLAEQGAQDNRGHSFLKDISRLEQVLCTSQADAGFAIILTNDHLLWSSPKTSRTNFDEFRLHSGQPPVTGIRRCDSKASDSIKKSLTTIELAGAYRFHWRSYGIPLECKHGEFRYLVVPVTRL